MQSLSSVVGIQQASANPGGVDRIYRAERPLNLFSAADVRQRDVAAGETTAKDEERKRKAGLLEFKRDSTLLLPVLQLAPP